MLTVTFPGLETPVALTYRVTEDTVVMTVTNYDGLPDGTYTCPQREDKTMMKTTYDGASLEYNSTTYEGGNILVGDPDALFNAYTGTGSGGTSGTGLSGATGGYNSPKTFDAGLAVYAASAMLSGAGLTVLRRRKR